MKKDPSAYSGLSIWLHWIVALVIVLALLSGYLMMNMAFSPLKIRTFIWHDWLGFSALVLMVIRLLWRIRSGAPDILGRTSVQRIMAKGAHILLYVLLVLVPLEGWLYRSASGIKIVFLEWIELPLLIAENHALVPLLKTTHMFLSYALLGLIVLHIAAALKHHLIDRDVTLARMIPWLRGA